ncbi:hypothetical protein IW492_03015 [Enterococcus sp. BWB1-3]|uniref:hypothetical protein n=1 Tax=unclassified Enterococcus TaxID=2608891 RepID=UPI001920BF21|nr:MULTISPECIES: hypothetical protein [unclassified Enterococcus]MBL1228203.1 hypothetical protein [Enterococcus sp. BWB1-3]MCB5951940.1 hypothetical protein [Enterococcus sp. BWT-B8]MCB5954136.1 hypothetical protein [Enterococcus sp. CWB-B31]
MAEQKLKAAGAGLYESTLNRYEGVKYTTMLPAISCFTAEKIKEGSQKKSAV